ncbi:terminal ear1-like [Musa troglodytarum]|nr:terminal ear1-like [Musa troglodytarum]
MLNPRAPPFEYSAPFPPPLASPPPLPPFTRYFLPMPLRPFPYGHSSPPYFYPPPCLHPYLLFPTLSPPPPPLPPGLSPPFSNQPCQVQQHPATQTDHLPSGTIPEEGIEQPHNNPPPPAPPHATVAHCPKQKDLKPREKKRLICRSRTGQSSANREIGRQYNQLGVSLEFDEDSHSKADQRTTVMIKNIPNKFSRDMLIGLLDEHCAKENEKAQLLDSAPSQYDFVYLPIDFKLVQADTNTCSLTYMSLANNEVGGKTSTHRNGCNLGYAFVNFTTAAAARRLYGAMHRHEWKVFGSKKISHVCYARIQGRKALVDNFKNSNFRCDTDEFFPAVLLPPRDGATSLPSPIPVGRRWKGLPR